MDFLTPDENPIGRQTTVLQKLLSTNRQCRRCGKLTPTLLAKWPWSGRARSWSNVCFLCSTELMQHLIKVHLRKREIFNRAAHTESRMHPFFRKHKIRRIPMHEHSPLFFKRPHLHFQFIADSGFGALAKSFTGSD